MQVSQVALVAKKSDAGKPRMSLVPQHALKQVAEIMTFGAVKYGDNNYLIGPGLDPQRLIDASLRHTNQYLLGEILDSESGLPHLAHACASLMMALEILENRKTVQMEVQLDPGGLY